VAVLTPDQLGSQIHSHKLEPLYLFDGPEPWLKNRAIDQIIDAVLPAEARDLNLDRFSGTSADGSQVVNAAQSLPFLAERRLVLVNSTEEFSTKDQKIIAEGISNLPTSTCLIFLYQGKASLREEIPAMVSSLGSLVTFWTPFENQLPSWIIQEVKNRNKTINWDAARALAESCSSLQEISGELDKLFLFVGKKPQITLTDVQQLGLPDSTGDYKELEDAIWNRNLPEALFQAELLADLGKRGESIFPILTRVFRMLLLGHTLKNEKKAGLTEIYTGVGVRGKLRQNLFNMGMRHYSKGDLQSNYGRVVQADFDLKTGGLPSRMAVSLLLLNTLGKKKAASRA
jgi:DNA polymerase-3 subunit delta